MNTEAAPVPSIGKCVAEPCPQCPFNRNVKPGTLGGSSVWTYIGQITGPFYIPCHMHINYADPGWRSDTSKPQCAGAAIMRANVGAKGHEALASMEPDTDKVFASWEQFIAHHTGMTEGAAQALLALMPDPVELMHMEWRKALALSRK